MVIPYLNMCPNSSSSKNADAEEDHVTYSASENDNDSGVSVSGLLSHLGSEAEGDTDMIDGAGGEANIQPRKEDPEAVKKFKDVQCTAEKLAVFVISQTLGSKTKPADKVEETILRCVKSMTTKHEILFNGMRRRLKINEDTAYTAFISIANELFEGEKLLVNWGRIIALYAFGAQLALYCKEKNYIACGERIPTYVGRYAKDIVSKFVYKQGGWEHICLEFPPEDDLDNRVWKYLAMTAVGLGLVSAATFLASH